MNAKSVYNDRLNYYNKIVKELLKKSNIISQLRLMTFLLGIGLPIIFYIYHRKTISFIILLIFMCIFVGLIILHNDIINKININNIFYNINKDGLKRLRNEWKDFEDSGEDFVDEEHAFSSDLDLFGQNSLFQMINATVTYFGRIKLKKMLVNPNKDVSSIKLRQVAIKELSNKYQWRQNFLAQSLLNKNSMIDPLSLIKWNKEKPLYFNNKIIKYIRFLPIVTISFIIGSLFFKLQNYYWIVCIILQFFILCINVTKISNLLNSVYIHKKSIETYGKLLQLIEEEKFSSKYLKELQQRLKLNQTLPAYHRVKEFSSIMDMLTYRRMQLYIFFDILTLWDYQCVIALENWKIKYGQYFDVWLDVISEIEALSSFAILDFEHPDWTYPVINEDDKCIIAKEVGHPLIFQKIRVNNSIEIKKPNTIALITGSNMSGKSTFLRTIGINLVLAYAGAPVCANIFECYSMEIYTSMRVKDQLEENISSFYAELKRIKKILDSIKKGEKVFFLLDEIFKGTNSKDRLVGAKTLIKFLGEKKALGLISTHDIELGSLEEQKGYFIKNYHFEEYYKDNKICFDYILKKGLSSTFNAIYLMKQIGIEIDN